ncbi:MAG: hypothetical protein JXN64_03825 [Spirochaetes bacterium]|nr:hypothetical protein [Spirochaetota bacterium]
MEKKIKKNVKKVTKKISAKETGKAVKKTAKKEPKKDVKKARKIKNESYFITLLKKNDLIFASWKIESPLWIKRIQTAEKDPSNKEFLFINVSSNENGKYIKIDSLPVHGLENNWHIFIKNEYCGKRIICSLSYSDKKNKLSDILISKEIDIPYSIENIETGRNNLNDKKILVELSGIKSAGISGSDNTSW